VHSKVQLSLPSSSTGLYGFVESVMIFTGNNDCVEGKLENTCKLKKKIRMGFATLIINNFCPF